MSIFRMPTLSSVSNRFEGLRDRLSRGSRLQPKHQKQRHLALDPLEARHLLSVSPADYTDIRVNENSSEDQITVVGYNQYGVDGWDSAESMAMDNDGDFVVTWTRYDPVYDKNGNYVLDPTNQIMKDANVYARYFTDEVQRITIPEELTTDNDESYGAFYIKYGGNEIQKITISATTEPNSSGYYYYGYQENIAGQITLGFDVNGNGTVGSGESVTVPFAETNLMAVTANSLQTALQGLGGALADVTVEPISPTEFEIHFGDLSEGENQPMITVESTNFTNGFLPAVELEALREPAVLGPIYVSPDNPSDTAASIEDAFKQTVTEYFIGPYEFPPGGSYVNHYNHALGPYTQLDSVWQNVPGVSVNVVYKTVAGESVPQASLTEFEIIFDGVLNEKEGAAGKINHPELEFVSAVDETGASVDIAAAGTVETIKETSSEFRVNPLEPDSIFTVDPDVYDQTDAAVAMDADGDFVIVWTSESATSSKKTDVYARLFTPIGLSAPDEVEHAEGIMAKTDAFLVNTITAGMQGDASVGMDAEGNFTIAWSSGAQDLSYYNNVFARSYNRDGEALTSAYLVNSSSTRIHFNPHVAISDDGNVLLTWVDTNDESYVLSLAIASAVQAKIVDSAGNTLINEFSVGGAGAQKGAWDANGNFVVAWDELNDPENVGSVDDEGVFARMWNLSYNTGSQNWVMTQLLSEFAVNSANYDPARTSTWPYWQGNPTPAMDADGDLTIAYEGFGADVSDDIYLYYDFYADASADPANADLLTFFNYGFILNNVGNSYDIDLAIELELISAANLGATDEQLGRIRAILDEKATLLRGEGYGALYSQFDAASDSGTILYGDNIANADRDGSNQRWLLLIDAQSTGGSFVVRMTSPWHRSGYEDISISAVYTNNALNVGQTRTAIENDLEAASRTGLNWPENLYEGSVEVRYVDSYEIQQRESAVLEDGSAPWAYSNLYDLVTLQNCVVYEIILQGEVHDTGLDMWIQSESLSPDGEDFVDILVYQDADSGTRQTLSTLDMETDGDYAMVWLQQEEYTSDFDFGDMWSIGSANQNLYYRRFDESEDNAGASVTDLVDETGNQVDNGETIDGTVSHLVVTFDEEMLCIDPDDPDEGSASVLNTDNWILTLDGVAIPGAIVKVEFGMNKAAELSGTSDGMGGTYELSNIPTNKWEAVITVDANGSASTGISALGIGNYQIIARSSLQDTRGNELGSNGVVSAGADMVRSFSVVVDQDDSKVDEDAGSSSGNSATLQPETPNAVAVDDDGDYVVVWTAYDSGVDRVYMRLYDADGSPNEVAKVNTSGQFLGFIESPIIPVTAGTEFQGDTQRYASVAMDPDGDFVITWTNYRNGEAEIFARKIAAKPSVTIDPDTLEWEVFGDEAFLVNDYTDDNQKWSDVAMDTNGDFVITWASYAQEKNGQLGTGYGIYARRYDSEGVALAREFQVNVTTAGDQTTPSVAMAGSGEFVVAWTSDQNGTDDDVIVREFNADGSPTAGPLAGERRVNDIVAGHQRYPDVAMRLDGESYVVTWTDTAADISGSSVWAELSSAQPRTYVDPVSHQINATHQFEITVDDSFTIADLNVQLGRLYHTALDRVTVTLSHGGVSVTLFSGLDDSGTTGVVMNQTRFDDEATTGVRINGTNAIVPYADVYIPQGSLSAFDGLNASGAWTLTVTDNATGYGEAGYLEAVSTELGSWTLQITEQVTNPSSFLVNTTTIGHQMYSSVAMDTSGDFVITWSGKGSGSTSTSGHDVHYQRFDEGGKKVGSETLVNRETQGDQWISSAGMDAIGNFVIVWTGVVENSDSTSLYKYDSNKYLVQSDITGPIVTDMYSDTDRVFQGGVIVADGGAISEITVVFNEELSVQGGADGVYSVLNPDNWSLTRNGTEVVGGIESVTFGLNAQTNKWEAVVSFDGNGVNYGSPGLPQGTYVLTVKDVITDAETYVDDSSSLVPGNFLDSDRDGRAGTQTFLVGTGGYEHEFSIAASAQIGPEFRINPNGTVQYEQRISVPGGIGQAREENNRSVAVDHDGDFAVVWTAYGQDDSTDVNSGGVYVRLYDRNTNAVTGEILVNQTTARDQSNASIAMDADGDFVVVWQSENTDGTYDIYARLFDSKGNPIAGEFLVNTTTNYHQVNPSVAMDDRGAFVIVWATMGQDFSYFNDVYGRRYDRFGEAQGTEFQVNISNLPGTSLSPSAFEINPVVAVSGATGDFVVAWEVVTAQTNGVVTNTVIAGRLFGASGSSQSAEIQLDAGTGTGGSPTYRVARNPQLTVNDQGGFYMVWESYSAASAYDVWYSEYNASGAAIVTGQANMPQFAGQQVNPSIAVDADGDFSIVWNGAGATADPLNPGDPDLQVDEDDSGVFKIDYDAANQTIGTQTRVNYTEYGDQYMPTIAMEPDGDCVVVWSGVGVGDNHGIFARRYNEPTDTAGPTVSDWADEDRKSLDNGHVFENAGNEVHQLILTFDEAMLETGADRVTNPANYALLRGGIAVPGAIVSVSYSLNPLTNKYEAILTFDGDLATDGLQPLDDGSYTIQALTAVPGFRSGLRDLAGNTLYRTGLLPGGDDFSASFVVQFEGAPIIVEPEPPAVTDDLLPIQAAPVDSDAILVNQEHSENQFTNAGQSLAVDNDGDFVAAWTRYDGVDANDNPADANIYARYFTDEVQRLTLPVEMVQNNDGNASTLATFTLEYAAPEIQMLSITSGIGPFTTNDPDAAIDDDEVGRFTWSLVFGYDFNGNNNLEDTEKTVSITGLDEETMEDNAALIQNALQSLGGVLADVTVSAINPRDYLITFADDTAGEEVWPIVAELESMVKMDSTESAYLPAVTVSTLREGLVFQGIEVSQDDPMETAANIANAIMGSTQSHGAVGPVDSAIPARATSGTSSDAESPYEQPWWMESYDLEVEVTPVVTAAGTLSLTEFDITFMGSSGKQDHPEMVVMNAYTDEIVPVTIPSTAVTTRKQSSNEFRVNPAEGTATYNQTNPAVAMDADGDFVIVWESEVPNSQTFGSVSDIFARRFSPFGITTLDVPGKVTDIYGDSTGVRMLINPEAEDVQRLTISDKRSGSPTAPLTGTFSLKLGDDKTEPIAFNSGDLLGTADDIAAKLADLGYRGVTVVRVPTAGKQYRFDIRFGGESAGVNYPQLDPVDESSDLSNFADDIVVSEKRSVDFYTMTVNQGTANPQFDPAVAMDEAGNFLVAWANGGQLLSYFNHISVQRFNRDGERVGNEFQVNAETTDIQFAPSLALSESGNYLITWSSTADVGYALGQSFTASVRAKVFDATGNQIVPQFTVGTGGSSMAAFDGDDNYIITWQGMFDTDGGATNLGVHARQFALYNAAGQANTTPVDIRAEFRVNSSSTTVTDPTLWPHDQYSAQPAIDADGDLSIIYEGYGPDVSVNVSMVAGYFTELMSLEVNGERVNDDLWVYFDPFGVFNRGQEGVPVAMIAELFGNNGDVDGSIDQVLFRATKLGADEGQLGRLRAILEATVGQLRGEANGILLSQWDADPTLSSVLAPLYSDSVVNSYRDGQNQRYYVEIPMEFNIADRRWYQAELGTFDLEVENLLTGQVETAVVTVGATNTGRPINIDLTGQNIDAALESLTILGSAWAGDEGTVDVREVEPQEITDRLGTDWEIAEVNTALYQEVNGGSSLVTGYRNVLYEIVFQGSAHDTPFEITVGNNNLSYGREVTVVVNNVPTTTIVPTPAAPPNVYTGDTYGFAGTQQTLPSIGMEPDGDFVTLYTQVENYRNAGFVSDENGTANSNIYYRQFEEETDTAGPRVTDWADGAGTSLENDAVLENNLQYVVVTFDENMLSGDPAADADSILNTANFVLTAGGEEVTGGVISVAFGLSKAAELSGQIDPLTGNVYGLNPIPSNKWEAVITFDGDLDSTGAQPLRDGTYSFEALASVSASSTVAGHSGLRDRVGNTLYHTGYTPQGADFLRSFSIQTTEREDQPVDVKPELTSLHTSVESPGAIAADADGQYVVVFTARQDGLDKAFYQLYDANGTLADVPIVNSLGEVIRDGKDNFPIVEVTPKGLATFGDFIFDTQLNATVAIDADGDFVVTWTNYRNGNPDTDVYARRFDSMGEIAGVDGSGDPVFKGGVDAASTVTKAFLVNNYTKNAQKWSNVAMDVDGDFIITWSSYGQEDDGQLGMGYGVYARRYDSFGQSLGSEFQVNVTEAGNQRFSNVAMDSQGGFTLAWTSNQNGISDDIIVRDFYSDGTPVGGPLGGEIVANQTQAGDQRYPDIAMNLAGDQYVVTWSASGQDGSGWGVYGRLFNRSNTTLYVTSSPGMAVPDTGTAEATLNVSNNAIITDVNVQVELSHDYPSDLTATLISPTGTSVVLFTNVPRTLLNGTLPSGSDFSGTLFDDSAPIAITDADNGAVPPFAGTFRPSGAQQPGGGQQQATPLAAFNGENVNGQWRLEIIDSNGNDRSGLLEQWTLIVERSAVPETEFRVNTTSAGNQMYSSVAMDHQGEFVVTWSGFGNQPGHEDPEGSGVFLQRFEATGDRISTETRVNKTTAGDQAIPSVSSDGTGNYYIAYTGVRRDGAGNNIPGQTTVFTMASRSSLILQDNDPPIVTDVQLTDGTRCFDGDAIESDTSSLLVLFGESMSETGISSVEDVSNWALERNGAQMAGAIKSIDFHYSKATRKYQAEVTLDPSVVPLSAGEYVLSASVVITDKINSLDGDRDGIPGSNPTTTTQPGYQFSFNVSNNDNLDKVGAEYRVNEVTSFEDRFSAAYGSGTARETSNTTLAVDHDGDYVVVWTRYGQDDPNDSYGAGVYMRLFDREDNALTDEIQVNTFTEGHQRNPSVAMDADGDLIVVWESVGGGAGNLNVDKTYDIYARRFSAAGTPLDFTEQRVNTELTGHQVNPAVAVDDAGNFVVVWATAGQDFSFYNNVKGQMFRRIPDVDWDIATFDDFKVGLEFLVNSFDIPGVGVIGAGGFEINPAVAMGGVSGNVVVAWEVVTAQQDGVIIDTEIAARIFNRTSDGTVFASGPEFAANLAAGVGGGDTQRVARNPQLAIDDQDGFIVVWESFSGTDYDVFYQEFASTGVAAANAQVNMVQFTGQQVNPSVAIDADGDFAIVFNGNGAQPDPLAPTNPTLYAGEDSEGIWVRRYNAANVAVGVQSRVNVVTGGIQQFPTIGMEPDGDRIVAWSGRGVGDQHGIFVRRYDEPTDTAGPRVTELRTTGGTLLDTDLLADPLAVSMDEIVVVFDEELRNISKTDADSVENIENWRLERAGVNISDQIKNVEFYLDWDPITKQGSNKWEAHVTFKTTLQAGQYTLRVEPPVPDIAGTEEIEGNSGIRDKKGNPLGQDGLNPSGQTYLLPFRIKSSRSNDSVTLDDDASTTRTITDARTSSEAPNAVAMDADGDYVTVFVANDGSRDQVYFSLFDPEGAEKSVNIPVASNIAGNQRLASVAMDADGDFIVTWTNYVVTGKNLEDTDIYARRFYADGTPNGSAFPVNMWGRMQSGMESQQKWSDVAMDIDGDFVIVWSSDGQEASNSGYGVYARRYDSFGSPLTGEFRVNLSTVGDQRFPSVAMDAQGGFYVAWASNGNGLGEDIIGRSYYSDASPIPTGQGVLAEQTINTTRSGNQLYPDVDMNLAGDSVVVTWASANQDGDGWGVFARSFKRNLDPLSAGQQPLLAYTSTDVNLPLQLADPPASTAGQSVSRSTLVVSDGFFIADVNINLTISHPDPRDLKINLISPTGTVITLVENMPPSNVASWDPALARGVNGFLGTDFDDEGDTLITNPLGTPPAVTPFTGVFIPEERLRDFDGENALGTWTLEVVDTRGGNRLNNSYPWVENGAGVLQNWSLQFTQQLGGPEFQVNDTAEGNQLYPSIDVDQNGSFVIAWSGRGDQEFEEDVDGVFYKRYDSSASPISGETCVTSDDTVRQWMPSVGGDANGNFVIVYTGNTNETMNGSSTKLMRTDVYEFGSQNHVSIVDQTGPLVTDVLDTATDTRLVDGSSISTQVTQLTVLFSEEMAVELFHPGRVNSTTNWNLSHNGNDIPLAIRSVSVKTDDATGKMIESEDGKYEAVLTIDYNPLTDVLDALKKGEYILTAWNTIHDAYIDPDIDPEADPNHDPYYGANPLTGNFDLGPGTSPGPVGSRPFTFRFQVADSALTALSELDGEYCVNLPDDDVDRIAEPLGTGQATERAPRAVATDDDGDLAIVWTSYLSSNDAAAEVNGVSNPSDIYLRLVDRNDAAGEEILVNAATGGGGNTDPWRQGIQRNATVAMDADGDLIVVWESEQYRDKNGNEILEESLGYDIWARRFDAMGNPLDAQPFRVNREIGGTQHQPAVAMDDYGNCIVVWSSTNGAQYSYFTDLYGQRFDMKGRLLGSEFQINELSLPGTSVLPGSVEANPAVALHEPGSFVVAWEQVANQVSGVSRDTYVVARGFDSNALPLTTEFRVDESGGTFVSDTFHDPQMAATASDDIRRTARNPQIAMDAEGNYIVVWESFHDNDVDDTGVVDSFGIYFREFFADHTEARPEDHQANLVITTVGLGIPDPSINSDKYALDQVNPSIAIDADGDFAIVWNGNGATAHAIDPDDASLVSEWDRDGVFVREFHAGIFDPNLPVAATDDVYATPQSRVNRTNGGVQQFPTVAMEPDGDYVVVWSGAGVGDRQGVFFRRYQTAGDTAGPLATELRSASNQLIAEGDSIFVNPPTLKVIFNEEMSQSGGKTGFHSVLNPNNWALIDGQGSEMTGAISKIEFALNDATNKWEAVLTFNTALYPNGLENGYYSLIARTELYDIAGNPLARTGLRPQGTGLDVLPFTSPTGGMAFSFRVHELSPGDPTTHDLDPIVNSNVLGNKSDPAIARNASGRYVVVWAEQRGVAVGDPANPTIVTSTDIFARIFQASANGQVDEPVVNRDGNDGAFLVNSLDIGNQITPDVAIDDLGNFVIVWSGQGISGLGEQDDEGIFGQRFAANGDPIDGQFGINLTADGHQDSPTVAMNATGDFVVTWRSQGGIVARQFKASGARSGELAVNTASSNNLTPDVAIDNDGDFTIVWAAAETNGSLGVFAQRYSAAATKVGGPIHVNQYQTDPQDTPRIAMNDAGDFVIAWQSFGQDAYGGYGVYARRYDKDGNALSNEFLVNQFTTGYQFEPSVAMAGDPQKGFVITWSSFNQEGDRGELYGIHARMYDGNGNDFALTPGQPLGEFRVNAVVEGDQRYSDVAMDAAGHYVVVWQGTSTQIVPADPTDPASLPYYTKQTDIYARFVDPPTSLSTDGKTLDLVGTPDGDTFEFVAGATPNSWIIKINGEPYPAASTVETINFNGMGGNDTIILTGTAGAETVNARPGEVTFQGSNFTVNVSDAEYVTVDGKGGTDTAELRDSAGSDALVMKVGETVMSGPGYSNTVRTFEQVYAYSTNGGADEAKLYDSAGNDAFMGTPVYARMTGNGYMHRAKGFRAVHGYSTSGADEAELHDSAGNDKFKHESGQSKMYGGGFYVRAKNFATVKAIADGGGNDYARFFDSSSADTFVGTPTSARMYSAKADYDVTGELFERVLAYSSAGGNDIAQFTDSAAKEVFWGLERKAEFSGDNFQITARKFESVEATSTPGSGDIAKLRDTAGNDRLVVDDESAQMYKMNGDEMELLYEVFAFDQVKTYRSSGIDTKVVASTVDFLLLDDGWTG